METCRGYGQSGDWPDEEETLPEINIDPGDYGTLYNLADEDCFGEINYLDVALFADRL